MDVIILTVVGVASAITLVVAFILCAKRQSFTIDHDFDPNYVSPAVRARSAYRVRQVHQPVHQPTSNSSIENGHSKTHEGVSKTDDLGPKKREPEVIVNNNVTVDIVKETPGDQPKRKEEIARGNPAIARVKEDNEVQRVSSKRKAPTVPATGPTPSVATSAGDTLGQSSAPPVAKTAHSSSTTAKTSNSHGQKAAPTNNQRHSKKATPAPKPSQPKVASGTVDLPNSGTSSLPRPAKATPSPEKVHYAKKSSTLPGRSSSKRPAPVAPGQVKEDTVSVPIPPPANGNAGEVKFEQSQPAVDHAEIPVEVAPTGGDSGTAIGDKSSRQSRHVLDRLPSLPKENAKSNSFDSGVDVQQTIIDPVPNGLDSVDGPADVASQETPAEDPYSVIKNRKVSEENTEHLNGDSKYTLADSDTPNNDDKSSFEPPVSNDDGVIIESPSKPVSDASQPEATTKAEPPYAKVIKRNKRNRANVKVHFNLEHPEEAKPKKPPTPGALMTMSSADDDKETQGDDLMIIPEGASYD